MLALIGAVASGETGIIEGQEYMGRNVRSLISWVGLQVRVHTLIMRHAQTPLQSKILLGFALGYAISPIGLIPDFIPIVGYVDDIIIVPILMVLAVRMVPPGVVEDCKRRAIGAS